MSILVKQFSSLSRGSALGAIYAYQTISALCWRLRGGVPEICPFYPSCADYARRALVRYGFIKGATRSLRRLLRCHPWQPGGVDYP